MDDTLPFYVQSLQEALQANDYEQALEWREGILRHLAWQHDPKTVATIDEAIKAYEREQGEGSDLAAPKPLTNTDTANPPSGDLNERLQDILEDWYPGTQYSDVIPLIKAAIKDAGYRRNLSDGLSIWSKETELHRAGWMTGAEWYARFWEEYETELPKVIDATIIREQVDKIAKRAAGIDEL